MRHIQIIVETHDDGFVAYPLRVEGVAYEKPDVVDPSKR